MLVVRTFKTDKYSLIGRKNYFTDLVPEFYGCRISIHSMCQQANFIQCVKYGYTYIGKTFADTQGIDVNKDIE